MARQAGPMIHRNADRGRRSYARVQVRVDGTFPPQLLSDLEIRPRRHTRQAKAEEGKSHNKRAAINTGLPPGGLAPPEAEVQKRQARGNTSMDVREERPCGLTSRHFCSENTSFLRSRRVYPNFFTRGASPRGSEKYWTLRP